MLVTLFVLFCYVLLSFCFSHWGMRVVSKLTLESDVFFKKVLLFAVVYLWFQLLISWYQYANIVNKDFGSLFCFFKLEVCFVFFYKYLWVNFVFFKLEVCFVFQINILQILNSFWCKFKINYLQKQINYQMTYLNYTYRFHLEK